MEVPLEELKRIGGGFQQKYGLAMDSLTAALLHEVYESGSRNALQHAEKLEEIRAQMAVLKDSCKSITTSSPRVSFAYGLGRFAWSWLGVVLMGWGLWLHHVRETSMLEYRQARRVVERYPNLVQLEPLIRSARLVERQEGTFLQMLPAREKLEVGRNYVVDPNRPMKENAQIILIPLRLK